MNCCTSGNGCLWILIILLVLGTCSGAFSSSALSGCGWPVLAALAYCMFKNGTLGSLVNKLTGGCCNH